jgi:DNA-binding NarL/FixJ family response regulator
MGSTPGILHDGRRAEELAAGRNRDLELSGVLLQALGLVPVGRAGEALPLLERSKAVLLEADPLIAPAEVFAFGAQVAMWLERYDLAEQVLTRQIDILRGASALGRLPFSLAVLSHLHLRLGRWSQAVAAAAEAVALARQTGQLPLVAYGLAALSLVQAGRGDAADAMAGAREASAIVDQLGGGGPLRIYTAAALGFAAFAADQYGDALDHMKAAAAAVEVLDGREPAMLQFDPDLIELLVRAGDREGALERLAWLDAAAEMTGGTWARAVAERVRGQLATDDEAPAHFERALELHARDCQPFVTARTRLAYGQRLRRAGERTASREQLTQAGEVFQRLGATRWAERAQEELKSSGQTLRRRALSGAEELTPSELQVALRVAEGLTNREVAAAIFLSPKTVEHHLSAIYRKLGIRSRTELARHVAAGEAGTESTVSAA